jgi:hypothetical protein
MVRIIMGSAAGRVSDILFIFIGYSKKVASVFTRLLFYGLVPCIGLWVLSYRRYLMGKYI